ncbi:MAG TPA: hypothetical protein VGM17_11335 [Rhizomicrobium sp.]|jgi:anti-sigma factor RsiW
MSEPLDIRDVRLNAFLDGELAEQDRDAMERTLAADAELAERLALYRADKARLGAVYSPVLDGPAPASWIEQIESHRTRRRGFSMVQGLAASLAFFAVLIGGTLLYRQQTMPHEEPIVEEALSARQDALPPRGRLAVHNAADSAAATRALASALAMRLEAPDLSRMGYRLASVEIYDHVPGGKAVELLYRQRDNRTFAMYVRHSSGAVRFDEFTRGKIRVCIWQDEVVGAVMTGHMSAAEMQRLAALAYSGLES